MLLASARQSPAAGAFELQDIDRIRERLSYGQDLRVAPIRDGRKIIRNDNGGKRTRQPIHCVG